MHHQPYVRALKWVSVCALIGILVFGAVVSTVRVRDADARMRTDLIRQASLAAWTIDATVIHALSGDTGDVDSPVYLRLKRQLMTARAVSGSALRLSDAATARWPDRDSGGFRRSGVGGLFATRRDFRRGQRRFDFTVLRSARHHRRALGGSVGGVGQRTGSDPRSPSRRDDRIARHGYRCRPVETAKTFRSHYAARGDRRAFGTLASRVASLAQAACRIAAIPSSVRPRGLSGPLRRFGVDYFFPCCRCAMLNGESTAICSTARRRSIRPSCRSFSAVSGIAI